MKSTVFLSHTSTLSETAARIELSLRGEGFAVFRDRSMLPPGESFDGRIRTAIEQSDLFVFLVTPESVAPGRYTLSELKFAEQKWPHPAGRVLPVFAEATPTALIPAYLRAVTILQPRGDIVAEIAAEALRMSRPLWRRLLEPRRLVPALAGLALVAGLAWIGLPAYLERRGQSAEAQALIEQSESQARAGNHAEAWQLLAQASAVAPGARAVFEAQERLAMQRLRVAGLGPATAGRGDDVAALVKTSLPVLTRGTAGAEGERLADLLAHIGWADYLRGGRSGSGEPDPARQYARALETDAGNVYAHAMWGFELLRERHSPAAFAEARQHFAAALAADRDPAYVRHLQVSALLQTYSNVWIEDPERRREVIRAVNEMRVRGEPRPKGWGPGSFKGMVWTVYHFGVVVNDDAEVLAALPPAEHLTTFRWLFPEDELAADHGNPPLFDYLAVLATLQEQGDDRTGALATYRRLLGEFERKQYSSGRAITIADRARAAVQGAAS